MTQDTNTGKDRGAAARKGGWRKWLLVGSLGLNLMVAGLVAGAFIKGGHDGRPPRVDVSVGPLTRAMAPEDRAALRARLRERGAFDARDRRGILEDMQALLGVLRADSFDGVAFRAILERQRARLQSGQDSLFDALTLQINDMNQQQRAAFADRLEQQMRRVNDRSAGERPRD